MKPPLQCPFCDAPRVRISEPQGVWAEYRCGTSKGAKGSKWLWFQTCQCKENAKKTMTTQPPSPEAVEAAMKWARDCSVTDKEIRILGADDPYSYGTDTAARILAAEVERLRARVAELEGRQ